LLAERRCAPTESDRDYCRQRPGYISHSLARHRKTRLLDKDDAAFIREYLDEFRVNDTRLLARDLSITRALRGEFVGLRENIDTVLPDGSVSGRGAVVSSSPVVRGGK